jgi:transcriptional regulator with XRE-family HTH domain
MEDNHTNNRLVLYRKRIGMSQKDVSAILELRGRGVLSRYERGAIVPSLQRALELEIVYRVPVAFLFPEQYEAARTRLRNKENELKQQPKQPTLF